MRTFLLSNKNEVKFTARLRKIAKVTKWEQSQGKIVVKLIDKGYINKAI